MLIKKPIKIFLILGVIHFSIVFTGCEDDKHVHNFQLYNDSNTSYYLCDCGETKDLYYISFSFDNIQNWPKFIGEEYNLSFGERRYNFILSFSDLKNTFETSTGDEVTNYFHEEIFNDNYILCIVRDETGGTANIKYSNFKINGLQLSIEETFINGGAEVVSRYLDFVVIPKDLFPNGNFNPALEYYWKK